MVLRDACASKKYEKGTTKYGKSKQKVNDKCNKVGENNVVKKKYKESTKKYVKIQKSKENVFAFKMHSHTNCSKA